MTTAVPLESFKRIVHEGQCARSRSVTDEIPVLLRVMQLHDEVDAAVAPLERRHANRLQCRRGCTDCCVDDLTVFEVEAERIREKCADVLQESPHPAGACAFLDAEGACRIYAHRPYVCRTQGLPLRWIDDEAGAEMRDICPLNESGPPVESLTAEACWTLGPFEGRLAALQQGTTGTLQRVRLRDLFSSEPG